MRIGSYLSTLGGSPLQGGLERGLRECGHTVEEYRPGGGYDLLLIFNQVAHTLAYQYPPFPTEDVPFVFIDAAEYGYFRRLPSVVHYYANTFSPRAMTHDTKVEPEQLKLRRFLEGKSFPYMLREFSKYVDFPAGYHPIDYPLYHQSHCTYRPDREEYLRRDLELFVSWGASHPWRLLITDALRAANRKCEIGIIEQDGHQRMRQDLFFQRTRAARCSVSYDGYGSGSFRVTEILVRTLLLQGPLSIYRHAPLIDRVHCREYRVEHDGETFLSTNVADVLREALEDPEGSYAIFAAGHDHCMTHYTEKATAEYLLETVRQHDWRRPTQLDIPIPGDGETGRTQ